MFITDLTNCNREPIHIPGKIQHQGFLIAIDKSFIILYCSENIADFLPVSASSLLEKPVSVLDNYLEKPHFFDYITSLIQLCNTQKKFEPANPYPLKINGNPFNLILSKSENNYLLEFEPEVTTLKTNLQHIIGSSLSEMLADVSLPQLLVQAVRQVKNVIGYDRVMIYQFHDDGHGEVVAEAKNENLEPFLGLHYPASDIPKQARELYKINLTRIIADVNQEASAILTLKDQDIAPLDLTNSALRAVSPIHIQYLKNMGVASSFSVSILNHGELWGLVACHNYSPRFINYRERDAAKLIGQVLSSTISFRQYEQQQHQNSELKAAVAILTKQLLSNNNIEDALFGKEVTLLNSVDATGSALFFNNQFFTKGDTPDEAFMLQLINWLDENMQTEVYQTNQLPLHYPAAAAFKNVASGLLVCRISKELQEYMLWFRPEVTTLVKWAGNPEKPVEVDAHNMLHLSPRKSFETWVQTVEQTATPWKNEDLNSALQLREEVNFAINRKATELRLLNEKLKQAYDELDSFSYTLSHDLKNPLSSIKSYSQLLNRSFNLEDNAKKMVERILISTDKMQMMIQEILSYSHVGQVQTKGKRINMDKMLQEIRQEIMVTNNQSKLEISIGNTPEIWGDETMVMQVFSNLLSNAVKYSRLLSEPKVVVNGVDNGTMIQYTITDNGIGIKSSDQEKIFDLFSRSQDVKDYEGSGVGLSIVKKIMEKHHGKIWVESDGETGSTFYVAFNKNDLMQENKIIRQTSLLD
ncbi:MAG: ATP-binding protein [Janthinobacterium lividum]